MHLNDLALKVKESTWANDTVGLIFNTIGVSDGISNGTEGMMFSLPSRDIIADSIETVVQAQWYDAVVAVVVVTKICLDLSWLWVDWIDLLLWFMEVRLPQVVSKIES